LQGRPAGSASHSRSASEFLLGPHVETVRTLLSFAKCCQLCARMTPEDQVS
jgi:hypothetical protein